MATKKFGLTPHTIYRGADFSRSSGNDPNVMYATHESSNNDFFHPGETLTLTLSDGTLCTGWTYKGLTEAIEGESCMVVSKGNCTYVLGTGDTNTPGNDDFDEKKAPPKTSELNICETPCWGGCDTIQP